ncbi:MULTISPECIES: DUF6542 domain-containing protein [unclassified Streptomyces]|uniref:DUF6542 domain-containing protein n=1 Tax=unclassified Streptomyces TaxID=2593676 RepID=UPI002E2914EA|nr:DUF6542 domain-containing protein [Streptomyces sp. NBC_01601]
MEQHRTRPPKDGPPRGTPTPAHLPPQARRGLDAVRAVAEAPVAARRGAEAVRGPLAEPRPAPTGRRFPNPRLTGLGGGLFCVAAMLLLGGLDALLFGSSLITYGVLFLPVCVLTALWVRAGDVLTAPVALPIAFGAGLFPVADGGAGFLGSLMGVFTGLATQAGWLYGGTLVAGVMVLVRRVRWVRSRRRRT